jgi:hypothetical protein
MILPRNEYDVCHGRAWAEYENEIDRTIQFLFDQNSCRKKRKGDSVKATRKTENIRLDIPAG